MLADYLGRSVTGLQVEQASVTAEGVRHLRVTQQLGGVRVVGAYARAAVLPTGELVHVIDTLVPEQVVPAAHLAASDALALTLAHHGYASTMPVQRAKSGALTTFEPTAELYQASSVEQVAFIDALGALQSGSLMQT